MKKLILVLLLMSIPIPSYALRADQVIIDEDWIKEHLFWDKTPPNHQKTITMAIKWMLDNKYVGLDGLTIMKKLVAEDKLFWANFAVTELMTRDQYLDYIVYAVENYPFEKNIPDVATTFSRYPRDAEKITELVTTLTDRASYFNDVIANNQLTQGESRKVGYQRYLYTNAGLVFTIFAGRFEEDEESKYAAASVVTLYHAIEWHGDSKDEKALKEYQLKTIQHGIELLEQDPIENEFPVDQPVANEFKEDYHSTSLPSIGEIEFFANLNSNLISQQFNDHIAIDPRFEKQIILANSIIPTQANLPERTYDYIAFRIEKKILPFTRFNEKTLCRDYSALLTKSFEDKGYQAFEIHVSFHSYVVVLSEEGPVIVDATYRQFFAKRPRGSWENEKMFSDSEMPVVLVVLEKDFERTMNSFPIRPFWEGKQSFTAFSPSKKEIRAYDSTIETIYGTHAERLNAMDVAFNRYASFMMNPVTGEGMISIDKWKMQRLMFYLLAGINPLQLENKIEREKKLALTGHF